MDPTNPYAPPATAVAADQPAFFGELVRGWERLRLIYNGVMILPGLAVLSIWISRADLPVPAAVVLGLATGAGANAAFFLGPLAELYLRAMFARGASLGRGRWLIFSAGLLVSAGVLLVAGAIPFLFHGTR